MYGKAFENMYRGSMVGAGVAVFAVWGYVITNTRNSRVELNPKLLGMVLGGSEAEIQGAIEYLCAPDPDSTNKDKGGRRLIRESQFQYFVVSWAQYQAIKSEEGRREYNRLAQQRHRAKKKQTPDNVPTFAEQAADRTAREEGWAGEPE